MLERWPQLRSFRLRIALVSTVMALAAITALYASTGYIIVQRRASIIDRMLAAQLAAPLFQLTLQTPWSAIDANLNATFAGFAPENSPEGFVVLRVLHADTEELYRSSDWPTDLAPRPASGLQTVDTFEHSWRVGSVTNGPVTVWIAINRSLSNVQLRASFSKFAFALVGLAALIGLLSWYLAGGAMRPVERLTRVMVRLNALDLDRRVSSEHEDREFAELIAVFNAMLDRLQRSYQQAVRFSGDAAHELKTPLTILQGELERSFARAVHDPTLEQGLANMLDEVRRLDSIVRKLLLLARADAGQLHIPMARVNLLPMLQDLAEDIELMDDSRPVRLDLPPHLHVNGDAELLGQVLHNLVSNAIKYGTAGGWIALEARADGQHWQIDISNASEGIAPEHWDRLFDRFYRADQAHNRRISGVGLGLSLSRDITRAHGGALELADPGPGKVCFRLTLPIA
ncbi:HAMP domain-containing protein [Duganella ginsengisoli]|uniref:histidine kinase n=2 Tax=Pseudoduganella ginsengisoli TaxID=1462440 RepID=A0A6L6PU75_9BURK|nr:HAMP domain-containing protein [Pseudoduganella ginsengisoli]